ncbi:prepilin peptidase [Sphingosinicella sp.]|jgi:prepilin peptidase CpaA|uniref:A24 family peptidase n=1 Tax=Sphingosinicella sp. TaxID=1917971 RepID=UPI00260F5F0C|nr:prepilin peptidase [Sphingosinicella sp.]
MAGTLQIISVGALFALLAYVIYSDVTRRIIPNTVNAAVALLAVPFWLGSGEALWPLVGWQLLLAVGVFAVFAGIFALGAMGGGDVKLLTALALWLPAIPYLRMLVLMSIIGGVLTLAYLVWHRKRGKAGNPEIPYGCAICLATFVALGEPIVKQLAG